MIVLLKAILTANNLTVSSSFPGCLINHHLRPYQANVRRMFPGLGLGTVAFVIAVAIEKKMKPASDHH